jgi:hypothetical protein
MSWYKPISLILAVLFAVTGLLFLFIPDQVLVFFNNISAAWGMSLSPVNGVSFYLILAAGYMYLVTFLAVQMFRHPENRTFPLILINAKLASSILSLAFFLAHGHYLIYLANCIIDGFIGIVVLVLYLKMKEAKKWATY